MKKFSILFIAFIGVMLIFSSSCGLQEDVSPNEIPRMSSDDPKVKFDPGCWQERMEQEITARGGEVVSYDTLGGHAVEAVFPLSGQRGPGGSICLYSSGGYSIPIRDSRMLYKGIKIMNGFTDQLFNSSPIILAESGVEDPDGPQDATNHMSGSYNSIYLSPATFCLDIESYVDGTSYVYIGSLLVENLYSDLITQVKIRYEFGSFHYDQNWNPYEVETCEPLPECDGFSPGIVGGGL